MVLAMYKDGDMCLLPCSGPKVRVSLMTSGNTRQGSTDDNTPLRDTEPPHILLIEDDDVMREMLAEALRHAGYQVTECNSASQWLESCVHQAAKNRPLDERHDTYDVVVSDIRMPNMSGLDVLRILRVIRCDFICPPTILITAFGNSVTHERARELGAMAVLDKPFPIKYLIEKVREATTGAPSDQHGASADDDTNQKR